MTTILATGFTSGKRLLDRSFDPRWLATPGVLFLIAFLLFPGFEFLSLSLVDPTSSEFSLAAFRKMFATPLYVKILDTTFAVAAQTTLLSLILGYPLAFWLTHQPPQRRRIMTLVVLVPFWMSPLVLNFAWLVLLARTGAVARALMWLGFPQPPDLLFNHATVVFSLVHSTMPLAVVTMLPVMSQIDARYIKAAATLGATANQAFFRIYLPLSMPGVAAAGLLVFISTVGFFITPAILGGPHDTMLGQLIINQIQKLQNWPLGSALASMLITVSILTCLVYDRVFGLSSLSGASDRRSGHGFFRNLGLRLCGLLAAGFDLPGKLVMDGRLRWLLLTYVYLIIGLSLAPIVALIPMAFTSSSFLSFPPPGVSLRWFEDYLGSPIWITATLRSFGIGLVTAILTLVFSAFGAFAVSRTRGMLSSAVFTIFLLPMVIPSIVIAIALFYLFAQIGLVATDLGIVIGHTVTAIPISFIVLLATLKSYEWPLNQAAATLGANHLRVLTRIMIPLIRPGLSAAFIFAFLQSFQELTIAMFVGGGLKTTLPKEMWDSVTLQVNPTIAAASVVMMFIVTGLFICADQLRWRGRTSIE